MIYRTQIRGTSFRPALARAVADQLEEGEEVTLEREPSNPYDHNAVRIIAHGEFIGYVQADLTPHISPILDAGEQPHCTVHGGLVWINFDSSLPEDHGAD